MLDQNPLWYKDAILYELHVRAFFDRNGDGIGDFRGLAEKLDYLQDLGVTAIWLLPFYPSPLKDDGYDIADYTAVHPSYGTLADFKFFVREAHRRGLRVVTELVCNHTSDQHPWFQRARRAKAGSVWRNFYVWSDTPEKYREARIIFKDFETSNWTWDPAAGAYYWHRFYAHQPDLNYDNPMVRKAIFKVLDFWLRIGVDGLRLDAVPYLYERDGTNCENLPETHAFLKELRRHVDERFQNRMLLAEANQWPEHAAAYLGDECHMAFHFPLMPRLFMALRMEDRFPVVDILTQTPPISETSQWALFLRNHDELTLEMVTDEERDYMYRAYAHDPRMRINLGIRRRLAPLLGNHRRRIELMNGLLFSLPGTPVIYYGDEIGMGDNIYLGDRNGVRTPMQWSADRNAGFSKADRQRLYLPVIVDAEYHYETVNVETLQNNPHSLLSWMKRLISLRKRYKAFGRGSLEFLHPENRKVLAYVRRYEDESILVIANLSRFAQCVELDLNAYRGMIPVEMFGRTEFPPVGDRPYFFTLGPHAFFWFSLEPQRLLWERSPGGAPRAGIPTLVLKGSWEAAFWGGDRDALAEVLPFYLANCRWFGGKARRLNSTRVTEVIPVPYNGSVAYITLVQADYTEGDPETYILPLALATGEWGRVWEGGRELVQSAVARLQTKDKTGILYDALWDPAFCEVLLDAVPRRRRFKGESGTMIATPTRQFARLRGPVQAPVEPVLIQAEQSNSTVLFGDRLMLKLFRRAGEGINPDLEISRFLAEQSTFTQVAPLAGSLEYFREKDRPVTLAVLQGFVPNKGDAWQYTLGALSRFFGRVRRASGLKVPPLPSKILFAQTGEDLSPATKMIGGYMDKARLLGRRTAELHLALAARPDNPDFAPEPFTTFYQRSLYQSMRSLTSQVFLTLRRKLAELPEAARAEAQAVLDLEGEVLNRFQTLLTHKIDTVRTRCHGDYHLGQLLYTGEDFVIIDFDGEPARPVQESPAKRTPLRDVAGMLRSFHYAAYTALYNQTGTDGPPRGEDRAVLEPWARFWHLKVSAAFLDSYFQTAGRASFLPETPEQLSVLLDACLLEKAVYELGYELNNRPEWVPIPLKGILELLQVRA
ncbi:maltose alpha-D-glucosyltransferase [Candidatus Desulforudis audaxviator]|uniref:Maltokinase n=1 Tax=Desulforudis audaxviator (strain MP104C) TaxID=477974 RepID=B1I2Z5_DESAP|nr:maltose alpha-D-glucosyltransferase [Candidatus Desulforudis audaxviator]ACA59364.1 trehalose synthase [Candidatus Desulforudis audaxviator MP104C]AZK59341.1 Trehalose synthase [Candidatus Desulforudis audaxviator]